MVRFTDNRLTDDDECRRTLKAPVSKQRALNKISFIAHNFYASFRAIIISRVVRRLLYDRSTNTDNHPERTSPTLRVGITM